MASIFGGRSMATPPQHQPIASTSELPIEINEISSNSIPTTTTIPITESKQTGLRGTLNGMLESK